MNAVGATPATAGGEAPAAGINAAQIGAWLALLALTLALALHGWGALQVGIYQDDAHYLVLARSLTAGEGYGLINVPGSPWTPKHPFGWPLLLAPVVWLFPQQLLAGAAVSLAATLISISLLFWGWPRLSPSTSRWWGLGVASLYALSPTTIGLARVAMSEATFLALVLGALVLAEPGVGPRRGRLSAALGAVMTLALFTRWQGITLWAAVLLRALVAGRGARVSVAAVLAGGAAALALIIGATSIELRHVLPLRYIDELRNPLDKPASRPSQRGTVVDRSLKVASGYVFSDLRQLLVPVGGGAREREFAQRLGLGFVSRSAGGVLAALVVLGTWRAWRRRALSATVLSFEVFYCGSLALWPWHVERFLYSVLPFLVLGLLLGVEAVSDGFRWLFRGRASRPAVPVAVVATVAVLAGLSLFRGLAVVDSRAAVRDLRVGASWLAANTPPDAVVLAAYSPAIYLYSGRKTVSLRRTAPALEKTLGIVDYVLLGPALVWRGDGVLAYDELHLQMLSELERLTREGRVTLVYESAPRELVRIYRVERGEKPAASPGAGSEGPEGWLSAGPRPDMAVLAGSV